MAEGFTFAVSASHKKTDYRVVLRDAQEIERVVQNLKQDPLWGWCEPQITISFDRFQGVATLGIAAIGLQTAIACQQQLRRMDVVPTVYTLDGLTQAIIDWHNATQAFI